MVLGDVMYCSGQVAINPANGELVMGTLNEETHQVMKNIKALLDEVGASFDDIVKDFNFLV